jgi:hypothetical protein
MIRPARSFPCNAQMLIPGVMLAQKIVCNKNFAKERRSY